VRLKYFVKLLVIGVGLQIALLLFVSPLVSYVLSNGKALPQFLIQYAYYPFIHAVIKLGGYSGESAMIWPPLYGVLLGILVYSALFALIVALFARKRDSRKLDKWGDAIAWEGEQQRYPASFFEAAA
jgi:ABC-type Na+ efflux pump permease subunit